MPRKPLIRSKEYPYHVTARGNNKESFPLPLEEIWEIFEEELCSLQKLHDAKIHAFVLMSNHFHLLITTPKDDLGKVMETLMKSVTRTINFRSNRSGRIFGGPYYWSIIYSHHHYDCVLKYVYRNPVKAKICDFVELYTLSSLQVFCAGKKLKFTVSPALDLPTSIPNNILKDFLSHLNIPFPNEVESSIKTGLRKGSFKPSRIGWRRPNLNVYSQKNARNPYEGAG